MKVVRGGQPPAINADSSSPWAELGAAFHRQVSGQHFGKIGITL